MVIAITLVSIGLLTASISSMMLVFKSWHTDKRLLELERYVAKVDSDGKHAYDQLGILSNRVKEMEDRNYE
jgi:hypothetical protein